LKKDGKTKWRNLKTDDKAITRRVWADRREWVLRKQEGLARNQGRFAADFVHDLNPIAALIAKPTRYFDGNPKIEQSDPR